MVGTGKIISVASRNKVVTRTQARYIAKLDLDAMAQAGKQADRNGLSRAGRGLQKHGGREGSLFPKPHGNVSQINKQGQHQLENILTSPHSKILHDEKSISIYDSNGRGAFFRHDGFFRGFLEMKNVK